MANYTNYGSTSSAPYSGNEDTRFSQLCEAIVNNIFNINGGCTNLERIFVHIGTSRDNAALRDGIHVTQQKTNVAIFRTTDLIKESNSISRHGSKVNKQQKLQTERLQAEFKQAVERYTTMQRRVAGKIRAMISFRNAQRSFFEEIKGDSLENEANELLQKQAVISDLEYEQNLALEREEGIRQIEEDILDVNQIFRDLSAMVYEQGETINSIDANIDRTHHDVESAREELYQAAQYQKSYRKKICCFAVIIAAAALILTIVLVTTLKK